MNLFILDMGSLSMGEIKGESNFSNFNLNSTNGDLYKLLNKVFLLVK